MKSLVIVIGGAVFAGVVAWYFGLGIVPAVVVVLVVGAIGGALRRVGGTPADRNWPPPPPPKVDGARREASELSWALRTRDELVDELIVLRVRSIAASRLAPRRLNLNNPVHRQRIELLIGQPAWEILSSAGTRRIPISAVLNVLEALDSLDSLGEGVPSIPVPTTEKQA
jgi:hypothetical protein